MRRLALIALVLVAAAADRGGGERVRPAGGAAPTACARSSTTPRSRCRASRCGSPARRSGRSPRCERRPSGKQAAVTLADRRRPVHAVPRQRDLRDPPAVADRRDVRRLRPRAPSATPALHRIAHGPGKGTYYLPVTRTHSPVDFDIVQDIYREPVAQRLAIILNELGTGLAARGSDLNAVIHRADPALGNTDQVLKILAGQNRALAKLATDSAAVLTPLARQRRALADFIVQANTTAVASAARARDISRSIQLLPGFLRQLRPLMVDLGTLADQGTPLASELNASAAALGREFTELTPFAKAARTSLIALGNAAAAVAGPAGRHAPARPPAEPASAPRPRPRPTCSTA